MPNNSFKPEFIIVIFIHYKPQIIVVDSQLVVDENDMKWVANANNDFVFKYKNSSMKIFVSNPLGVGN